MNTLEVENLRSYTQELLNHVHWVRQSFNLLPDNKHIGTCINYIDLQEYREEFCEELVNTITNWFYSESTIQKRIDEMVNRGRSESNAQSALRTNTFKKFRNRDAKEVTLQGQFGELLLFNFLQHFFKAVPLIRKMPISTNTELERFGADAIHYASEGGKHLFYLGEAKTYTSKYKFKVAFRDALESILNTYNNHRKEIALYIEDDFIEDQIREIAYAYKNGTIKNMEIHLVSIITYNETNKFLQTSEDEIKASIINIIEDRCKALDRAIFNVIDKKLYPRFNYIVFPVWKLDELILNFQKQIGK